MKKLRSAILTAVLVSAGSMVSADTLRMDGMNAMADDGRPGRGMTQKSVRAKYGSPRSARSPVGDPPITRWEYQDFIVYFEHDKVIHTVRKR